MSRKRTRAIAWAASGIAVLALCCGPAIAAKTPPTSKPAAGTRDG